MASYKSVWRGYEYYNAKNVITHIKQSDTQIKGMGKEEFLLLKNGKISTLTADFTENPQIELKF